MPNMLETKPVEPRESIYNIDDLIGRLSAVTQDINIKNRFEIEAILCLANEILMIKNSLEVIKNHLVL